MNRFDADAVIVGAGCAGLSLATHLLDAGWRGRRLVLLDPRERYDRDRTFCFFQTEPQRFAPAATHTWSRFRVAAHGRSVECRADATPYAHLPSDAFYALTRQVIEASDRTKLSLGTHVDRIRDTGDGVEVETSHGTLRARVAFDSRPEPPRESATDEIRLLQHFLGWEVRTEAPAFDPAVATLMDFVDGGDVHFVYVLPFDAHHALVEDTWFSSSVHPRAIYEHCLREYLALALDDAPYEIVRVETGCIPMTTDPAVTRPSRHVYRIGLSGGVAKPSTGYAFQFIQRHAAELARRLVAEELPEAPEVRSSRTAALDRIFLSFLRSHPERAPEIFFRLFDRVPTDVLIRFLSERSSLSDELRVMASLPALDFTREAARSTKLWLRRP